MLVSYEYERLFFKRLLGTSYFFDGRSGGTFYKALRWTVNRDSCWLIHCQPGTVRRIRKTNEQLLDRLVA